MASHQQGFEQWHVFCSHMCAAESPVLDAKHSHSPSSTQGYAVEYYGLDNVCWRLFVRLQGNCGVPWHASLACMHSRDGCRLGVTLLQAEVEANHAPSGLGILRRSPCGHGNS